ncbi:hypothetical protein CDD81_2067 [Ophiocordyceps australis]|uniref:Uncharacterized protein n=1 Tax=Ophiocordyceps australis TaxID=1399860 RepID=A0A2C5X7S7_9HYPO|nr:hypothetical protein CDD81_2067 [Ophiocordyceps australis]
MLEPKSPKDSHQEENTGSAEKGFAGGDGAKASESTGASEAKTHKTLAGPDANDSAAKTPSNQPKTTNTSPSSKNGKPTANDVSAKTSNDKPDTQSTGLTDASPLTLGDESTSPKPAASRKKLKCHSAVAGPMANKDAAVFLAEQDADAQAPAVKALPMQQRHRLMQLSTSRETCAGDDCRALMSASTRLGVSLGALLAAVFVLL